MAFVVVLIPLAFLDALGLYHATNWTYWIGAGLIAPWIAGATWFRRIVKSGGDETGTAAPAER